MLTKTDTITMMISIQVRYLVDVYLNVYLPSFRVGARVEFTHVPANDGHGLSSVGVWGPVFLSWLLGFRHSVILHRYR